MRRLSDVDNDCDAANKSCCSISLAIVTRNVFWGGGSCHCQPQQELPRPEKKNQTNSVLVPSSKARSAPSSVLAPFVAMPLLASCS